MRFRLAAAMVLAVAPAHAAPDDLVTRPLVLDDGGLEVRLSAEINIEVRRMAMPLSLAPDAWWGFAPRWMIGVIHSNASLDRIDAGATFCVRESAVASVDSTCHQLYRGGGLDLRFSALAGPFAVAPRLRLVIRDLDPFKPATTLGALMRWTSGRFSITGDPYVRLPLANHSLGNRAELVIPLWFAVQPASGWAITLQAGYDADFVVLRDGGHVPLGLGVTARVTPEVDLSLEAGWASLLGIQHDAKHGTVVITAGWRH